MKKLLLTACCIIILSITSKAQLDTIPNAGFENWQYTPLWTIEALGWHTNNSSIAAWNVVPDSTSYTGLLALKIEKQSYRGRIWSGFPLQNHPSALNVFMKNGLGIGDTAFIHIQVYLSNSIVDSGYAEIYGGIGTNFLPFTVNISQNTPSADSCVITLEGGNYPGVISFDDLSFSFPTSIDKQSGRNAWNIFPNPCRDILHMIPIGANEENVKVVLADMTGKKIMEEIFYTPQKRYELNLSFLPAGVYMLATTYSETTNSTFIIKQ